MAALKNPGDVKDVKFIDLPTTDQIVGIWIVRLLSSSDTIFVPSLESYFAVNSLKAAITVSVGASVKGQHEITITGGSAGELFTFTTLHRAGFLNDVSRDNDPWGSFIFDGKSVNIAGFGEVLLDDTSRDKGIDNSWTIAAWMLTKDISPNNDTLCQIGDGINEGNQIRILMTDRPAINIRLSDSGDSIKKSYRFDGGLPQNVWTFVCFTWNGSDILNYMNGGSGNRADFKTTDDPLIMTNTDRNIQIGSPVSSFQWEGKAHSLAIWNTVLPEVSLNQLYNEGKGGRADYNTNKGHYTEAINLQHWFRLGLEIDPVENIGKDYAANPPSTTNLMDDAVAVDVSNVEDNTPGT